MKVYVLEKGIVLAGKSWEIKQKLKEFSERYTLISEWIEDVHGSTRPSAIRRIK